MALVETGIDLELVTAIACLLEIDGVEIQVANTIGLDKQPYTCVSIYLGGHAYVGRVPGCPVVAFLEAFDKFKTRPRD